MKFAVIETGGKQYRVKEGDTLKIEKLPGEHKEGAKIVFDKVLLVDDGKETKVGTPHVSGAKVTATYEGDGKGKKVIVLRYKAKSNYSKKNGHRQPFTAIKIASIS